MDDGLATACQTMSSYHSMTLVCCASADSWAREEADSLDASSLSLVTVCVSQGVRHGPLDWESRLIHWVGVEDEGCRGLGR